MERHQPDPDARPPADEAAPASPVPGGEEREGASPPARPEGTEAAAEVEALRRDLAAATDAKLRAQAELENYRRRVARQIEEERRYALMPLLRDLLPVWDNLRRAIDAAEQGPEGAGLLEGVQLVGKQLEDVFQRHHCTEIEALGAPFDPHFHEAISQQPSADCPAGAVLLVVQPGFRLHDRVVRPAQVVVSAAVPQSEGDDHQGP